MRAVATVLAVSTVTTVTNCLLLIFSVTCNDSGENGLEWNIFPTSVQKEVRSPESRVQPPSRSGAPSRQAREPQGQSQGHDPLSRDELLHDLLRQQSKEIHVEDFLWTGSGIVIKSTYMVGYSS
jgi:hypothetical protein